jgi:hypothetical protein
VEINGLGNFNKSRPIVACGPDYRVHVFGLGKVYGTNARIS